MRPVRRAAAGRFAGRRDGAGRTRPWIAAALAVLAVSGAAAGGGGSGASAPAAGEARMVFVGDTGTGDRRARRVRDAIRGTAAAAGASHLFLLGDNVYPDGEARHIAPRFLDVYRPVLGLGVRIHAALGNHDVGRCASTGRRPVPRGAAVYVPSGRCHAAEHLATPEFGYVGNERYYAVRVPAGGPPLAEVFVLDTNTLGADQTVLEDGDDAAQLAWLDRALRASTARWRVVAMHHPIHSPDRNLFWIFGRRGPDRRLRAQLEPLFVEHGVAAVFQGHQHLYARLRPQGSVRYFVSGAGSRRPDAFEPDGRTWPRRDRGRFNHFVYVRATAERFEYCAVDAARAVRDGGGFAPGDAADTAFPAGTCPILQRPAQRAGDEPSRPPRRGAADPPATRRADAAPQGLPGVIRLARREMR